jgi:Ankyrin repeats (3 copies)/Ankyrin repeats (many copies)/Ankyrin repeat
MSTSFSFIHPVALRVCWLPAATLAFVLCNPADAQDIVSGDLTEWSAFARPPAGSASHLPVDDTEFAALGRGGPWAASQGRPLGGVLTVAFEQARAGRWDALMDTLRADSPWPEAQDRDGATLLTLAARQGRLDVANELLRRGADVERRGLWGLTPLGAAAMGGHALIVQALLRAGAQPERWSANGHTPLQLASRGGHVMAVRALLAAKADPMAFGKEGTHALAEAARAAQFEVMGELLAAGVQADAPDRNGLNAVHAAALSRQFAAVEWLRERGGTLPHPLTQVLLDRPADALPSPR